MNTKNDIRIVLFGAGSTSFGLTTLGDIFSKGEEALVGSTIVLHDINEQALNRMYGAVKTTLNAIAEDFDSPPFKLEKTLDPVEALRNANYNIVSIEHGPRIEQWMQDYYIPRQYGSKQIFGENGGPGGAFHSWRQIPPMLKIAHIMEDVCPNAWLLNFSNPMSRICWALSKASKIKTVGLCHGVGSALEHFNEVFGRHNEDLEFISAGLNHFYWITKVKAKNKFTMAEYGGFKAKEIKAGTDLLPDLYERSIYWSQVNEKPLVEECLKLYGYLPFPDQSHIGEYLPYADAYCPDSKYDYMKYLRGGDDKKARLDRTIEGKETPFWWLTSSEERAINIIIEMESNANNAKAYEMAVNVPNRGAISNLNPNCIVEVPAYIDKKGIHAVEVGNMPNGIVQLMQREVALQELVVDAAITGDRNTALQALSFDATIAGPKVAEAIFNDLYKLQKQYLPFK